VLVLATKGCPDSACFNYNSTDCIGFSHDDDNVAVIFSPFANKNFKNLTYCTSFLITVHSELIQNVTQCY
jgi:hypothetical protein